MSVSAKRHAQAVFQIALEKNEVDKWRDELDTIAATLGDPSLASVLESPKVLFKDKVELLNKCLPGLSQLALNFVYLLVAKKRLGILGDIVIYYGRMADAHKGLEHAEVASAIPLDEKERESMAGRLASITAGKILLTNKVDPDIIGGFVARIGDKLIDGSIRAKLGILKRSLHETTIIESPKP
ncbi:ATP synthase F1 subunit delta [Chloroflexota bacterium]